MWRGQVGDFKLHSTEIKREDSEVTLPGFEAHCQDLLCDFGKVV